MYVQQLLEQCVEKPITFYAKCESPFLHPLLQPEWKQ